MSQAVKELVPDATPDDKLKMIDQNSLIELTKLHSARIDEVFFTVPLRPMDGISLELSQAFSVWVSMGFGWTACKDFMTGFIEQTRQRMVHTFLTQREEKYLLMIDNDVTPCLELPLLLARHEKPVVAAPVMINTRAAGAAFNVTIRDENGKWRFPSLRHHEKKCPMKGLIEVRYAGTGAMLIRRDVLEAFPMNSDGKWIGVDPAKDVPFHIPEDIRLEGARAGGAVRRGEDLQFCLQVAAKGYQVYADMEAQCGHRKSMVLEWQDIARDPEMDADDWRAHPGDQEVGGK